MQGITTRNVKIPKHPDSPQTVLEIPPEGAADGPNFGGTPRGAPPRVMIKQKGRFVPNR